MLNIILKSLKDILSPTVLGFIFKVTLGAFFLMVLFFWFFWDKFSNLIAALIAHIPYIGHFEFIQSSGSFLVALLIAYSFILIAISILTSLYSPKLLLKLAKKNYGIEGKDASKITKSLYYNIKAGAIFLILLILFLPLLFVPILGQIIMLILWAILLKDPTYYDVASLFLEDESRYKNDKSLWIIAIVASLFNYIPILNLFAPIFAQIMFMHWLLSKLNA